MKEISSQGRTIFFVSHDTRAVEQFCSRVFLVTAGQLHEAEKGENTRARYASNDAQAWANERGIDIVPAVNE